MRRIVVLEEAAEDIERGLWPDAANVGDEEAEEVALSGGGKAVEDVGVFADLEVG